MLDIAGWVKVGSAVASVISKLHNTDTVFKPAPLTKAVARALGQPTGGQAIAERVRRRLHDWLDTLPADWLLDAGIEAALDAVVATLNDAETLPRLAVKIYARRDEMEEKLAEVGRPRRDALLGEHSQLLFDRVLSSSVAAIAELAPQSNTYTVEAATILLQEFSELAEQLDSLLSSTTANHAELMAAVLSVHEQVSELTTAKSQYLTLRVVTGDPDAVVAAVSDPRLRPYLDRVGSDRDRALALYEWNLEMSAAVYAGLAIVEVALRNAMDPHIGRFNARQPEVLALGGDPNRWLLNPARLLVKLTTSPSRPRSCGTRGCPLRSSIYVAQDRSLQAVGQVRKPTHDDVLAQTTFGMWGHLLPTSTAKQAGKGRARLWVGYVEKAFPYLEQDPTQLTLHVNALRALRNRVAHLEPVLDRHQLRGHLDSMRLVMGAISPSLEEWLPADRIDECIGMRPSLDPI